MIAELNKDGGAGRCEDGVRCKEIYSVDAIAKSLRTVKLARKMLYFDQLESTNIYCREHREELEDGTLVIADKQTAGRGSRGRSWESPAGVAVYMSLLLKPDISPVQAPMLTLVMAVSVARALYGIGMEAGIKWPNDIVVNGKKLAGILTEMNAEVGCVHSVTIGVGMNVLTPGFPKELTERATSLYLETGRTVSRAELVAAIINCFEEDYKRFLQTKDLSELLQQYTQFSATIGKEVRILDYKEEYTAYAVGVDQHGQLLVEKEDGTKEKVFADEVSVRGIYGYV